jgi:iron complex transport system substrate-binding protein
VTLVPAATETVCCLGLESRLVARSHECNFPASIEHLPVCTETHLNSAESSARIDAEVKGALHAGRPLYRIRQDVLSAVRPTHMITQDQCQVCAVGFEDVLHSLADLPDPSPCVVTMRSQCLSDVWSDLRHVAKALGVEARGTRQIAELRERLSSIEKRRPAGVSPRVACIEWMDPLMIAGNWVPELVEIAGGTVIAGRSGAPSDWLTWDALRAAAPDVIIVAPCGFSLQRTRAEWDVLADRPEWSRLAAVRSGRVYQVDGDHFLNRSGPRLVASVEILAEILFPDHFAPQHRGWGWMPV